jgi:hypothetical protein
MASFLSTLFGGTCRGELPYLVAVIMLDHQRRLDFYDINESADGDLDGATISIVVDLRRSAPAPVEQRGGRRHTGRRWGGTGAADACQRPDGQPDLGPR